MVKPAQPKIPVKYTRRLLFFAPSRLCIFALLFSNLTQRREGAETRRVLSISVFTSFALLYIQLTITKITRFPDSAGKTQSSIFLKDIHKNLNLWKSVLIRCQKLCQPQIDTDSNECQAKFILAQLCENPTYEKAIHHLKTEPRTRSGNRL